MAALLLGALRMFTPTIARQVGMGVGVSMSVGVKVEVGVAAGCALVRGIVGGSLVGVSMGGTRVGNIEGEIAVSGSSVWVASATTPTVSVA